MITCTAFTILLTQHTQCNTTAENEYHFGGADIGIITSESTEHLVLSSLLNREIGQPEHGRVFVEPLVEDTSSSGFNFDNPNPAVTPLLGE